MLGGGNALRCLGLATGEALACRGSRAAQPCTLLSWRVLPIPGLPEQQGGAGGPSPPVCSASCCGMGPCLAASPGYWGQQNSGLMMLPRSLGLIFAFLVTCS